MICEDPVVLEEILLEVNLEVLDHQRIGTRAVLLPAYELIRLKEALQARGIHPKIMGDLLERPSEEEEDASLSDGADMEHTR